MGQQNPQRSEEELVGLVLALALLPFLIYGALLLYAASQLLRRMRHYQLTWASGVVVLGLPALSLLVLFRLKPLPWPGLALLSPLLILGEVALILETWAFFKVWPFWRDIDYYRGRVHTCHAALAQLSERKKILEKRIQALKRQYGQALAEREKLSEILEEFCAQDVDNRTVLVQSWRAEQRNLSFWRLAREARLAAGKDAGDAQLVAVMRAVQARLTRLEMALEERILALRRWQEELEQCQREEGEMRKNLFQAEHELANAKEEYQRHRAARIRLD